MDDCSKEEAKVVSINISQGGIPKIPVERIDIKVSGLRGDGHAHEKHCRLEQAVSLQDIETLLKLREQGYPLSPGTIGENLTVRHLNVNALALGTILEFSGGVILEISKVRKPCYVLDAINPKLKEDILDCCGMYAKVLQEGCVRVDDTIRIFEGITASKTF